MTFASPDEVDLWTFVHFSVEWTSDRNARGRSVNYEPAILALEDGNLFRGRAIGAKGQAVGEVVFNTAMTGYQEILTDPSYARQIVTLTYPHIGNVGVNHEDLESERIWAAGLVIRDLPRVASNWRCEKLLENYLIEQNVIGIADIDTRRLTRLLREKGALRGCILTDNDQSAALQGVQGFKGMKGLDLAREVSTEKQYEWTQGSWQLAKGFQKYHDQQLLYHVVAYDFGIKRNILRLLVDHGCRVTVVPATTSAQAVLALKPDGVFLSNGPGDPEPCTYAIEAIQVLSQHNVPLFGICLGHQLLGLAYNAKTRKMKFGHHGANHPVVDLRTKQVLITSQNHGFDVDEKSLPEELIATHRSLFDTSLQGLQHKSKPIFGFQGHPEASPGPHDMKHLFNQFIKYMNE